MTTTASQLFVRIRARTGWVLFIVRVAQVLGRVHLPLLIPLWLGMMQPICIIAVRVEGSYRRIGPFRFRRWNLMRVPLPRVTVRITRKSSDAKTEA